MVVHRTWASRFRLHCGRGVGTLVGLASVRQRERRHNQCSGPWIGTPTTAELSIYTPPGYDPTKSRRYPTLYEARTPFGFWDAATNVKVALDTLIDTGAIPAAIVVFISSGGGPYDDSECADSFRRTRVVRSACGQTVVSWVDAHYRTIAQPAARAIMGMSQGGYCAAILALHHPTYSARRSSSPATFMLESPLAPTPLSPSVVIRRSSMRLAGRGGRRLAPAVRASLYFIVIAQTASLLSADGGQLRRLLAANGYPYMAIPAAVTHGWGQVRQETPTAWRSGQHVWAQRACSELRDG